MKISNVNCSTSFGKVSLSTKALINMSKQQIEMYHNVYDALNTNPNKVHFSMDSNKNIVLTVLDMDNNIIQEFLGSSKDAVNKAIECCKKLPTKSKDHGKHPIDFEKFLYDYMV